MKIRRPYSITAVISAVILGLFAVFALLGVLYFVSLERRSYEDQMARIEEIVNEEAESAAENLQNVRHQTQWIAANIGTSNYWTTDYRYEKMLLGQDIENLLTGLLQNSDIADSAFMVQRGSNILLEKHNMEEDLFLNMIGTFTGRRSSQPLSPSVFAGGPDDSLTHLILWEPVVVFSKKVILSSTNARLYVTIPIEDAIPDPERDGIFYLCERSGNTLTSVLRKGGEEGSPLRDFDFESFSGTSLNTIREMDESYLAYCNSLDLGDLYLVTLIPQSSLFSSLWQIILHGVLLLVFLLILSITGIIMVNTMINTPIRETVSDIAGIRQGDYGHRLKTSSAKEINEISQGINEVLDELQTQNEKVIETQKNLYEVRYLQRESQLMALQAQINPHFLYNTMECIRSIAQEHHVGEIIRIISAMIGIYRYSASGQLIGTVGDEVKCAKEYGEIMRIRFGDRFLFEFRIDESFMDIEMPKMILQPLMENAVTHGYEDSLDPGKITVIGECRDEILFLSVCDDGQGIPPKKLAELRNSLAGARHTEKTANRIGLFNVDQRMKQRFGEDYGLEIESVEGEYTRITIRIPLNRNGGENI